MKTLAVILLPCCRGRDAPAAIDALLDAARAAPAEFAADAMIRIAALDQLEKARRIELLEQAFQGPPAPSSLTNATPPSCGRTPHPGF